MSTHALPFNATAAVSAPSAAKEINRLHAEAQRLAAESRHSLDGALAAAWHAGCLLNEEKKRVRRAAGHGAWLLWLKHFFDGSVSTAHRYMRMARGIGDSALLQGLSLRQAYARIGIATEPKHHSLDGKPPFPKPPEHVLLASKLIRFLRQQNKQHAARTATDCIRDLAPLYAQLRLLFEHVDHDENFRGGRALRFQRPELSRQVLSAALPMHAGGIFENEPFVPKNEPTVQFKRGKIGQHVGTL